MQVVFILLMILYVVFAVYFAMKNDCTTVKFFLVAVFLQNIIVIIFHGDVSNTLITVFSLIKEGMIYLAVVLAWVRKKKIDFSQYVLPVVAIYVLIVLKNLIMTPQSFYAAIVSLRYLALPMLCVTWGVNVRINKFRAREIMRFILLYGCMLGFTGLVERFILGDKFWSAIGYTQYSVEIKGNPIEWMVNGVTVNFYTWDFGERVRRLVGITADPLATAYLLFLGGIIVVTGCLRGKTKVQKYKCWACGIFVTVCSLLVFSKAIYLFVVVVAAVLCYVHEWLPRKIIKIGVLVGGALGAVLLVLYAANVQVATAVFKHVSGLLDGLKAMTFFGQGVGTAGVPAHQFAGASVVTGECFIGSLGVQIGFAGLLVFAAYWLVFLIKLIRLWKKYHHPYILLSVTLLLGQILCMMLSESSVSIMGTGIFFFLIGLGSREALYLPKARKTMDKHEITNDEQFTEQIKNCVSSIYLKAVRLIRITKRTEDGESKDEDRN